MQEILDCLTEEIARYRGLAALYDRTHYDGAMFSGDYARKADLLEKAAEIVKRVEEIGRHGDLIDRDALLEKHHGRYGAIDDIARGAIKNAPTVIPANMEAAK